VIGATECAASEARFLKTFTNNITVATLGEPLEVKEDGIRAGVMFRKGGAL
jgi:hypothetical protein